MIQTKENILSILEINQHKIRSFGVKKLGIFGSFVHKKQNVESDVDMLVEFEHGKKNFDNFMHLSFFLEELFERHVELITSESLSPYIKPRVVKEVEYVTFWS